MSHLKANASSGAQGSRGPGAGCPVVHSMDLLSTQRAHRRSHLPQSDPRKPHTHTCSQTLLGRTLLHSCHKPARSSRMNMYRDQGNCNLARCRASRGSRGGWSRCRCSPGSPEQTALGPPAHPTWRLQICGHKFSMFLSRRCTDKAIEAGSTAGQKQGNLAPTQPPACNTDQHTQPHTSAPAPAAARNVMWYKDKAGMTGTTARATARQENVMCSL